ncbi:MAG: hypothetical protein C0524_14605 [Rhodobacter sp.]|nr:hypothetical protein [Rhodobacter sp.]
MLRPVPGSRVLHEASDAGPSDRAGHRLHQLATAFPSHKPEPVNPTDRCHPGRDFASQDYLALATHSRLRAAASAALGEHRLSPPGTEASLAVTVPVLALEERTARFLQLPAAIAFPSGAEAIRATLQNLIAAADDVIIDAGADSAMFETVLTARARLHRTPPGSLEAVERRLRRLTANPRRARIWVLVPAISAFASVMADVAELSALCRAYGAGLIVDVTHDLGAMAQSGGGVMEIQGCTGCADIVIGSYAQTFGAPGGFAAFRDPGVRPRLIAGQGRTAPFSPALAATILAAFDIIDSAEGRRRRRRLHGNSLRLRNHLMADGLRVMGQPSPLVPVRLPHKSALARTGLLESAGMSVPLLQAPTVAAHAPRWCLRLTAGHGPADIDDLADLIHDVTRIFDMRQRRRAGTPA